MSHAPAPISNIQSLVPTRAGALFLPDALVMVDEAALEMAWGLMREKWLESKRQQSGRENTVLAYQIAHDQFFAWALETWAVAQPWEITATLAEEWKIYLLREGKTVRSYIADPHRAEALVQKIDQAPDRFYQTTEIDASTAKHVVVWREPLSTGSVNLKLSALSSFYSYVKDHPYRAPDGREITLWPAHQPNPWRAVERPKTKKLGRAVFPTVEEAEQILAAINTNCLSGKRDFALLATYLTTCLRFDGLIGLKWGDIEPLSDGNYKIRYRYKGGAIKEAVLDAVCHRFICTYLQADGRLDGMTPDDYIFIPLYPDRATHLGHSFSTQSPISNATANGILKKHARRAGVDPAKAHIHALRHTGTLKRYLNQKTTGTVDPMVLQKLLGHESIETTMIYIDQNLDEPEDPGGREAALFWFKQRKKKRGRKPAAPEQRQLL